MFLYGELAEGRGPAFFRRGGLEELERRVESGELEPDFGPMRLDERAGGVLVGARRPLIAFNVNLRGSLEAAREIASVVRERGGGFPGVRALGFDLPTAGLVQVSMNVEDPDASPLPAIVERIEHEASARGAEVAGSELVGLIPASAAAAVAAAGAPDRRLRRVTHHRAAPPGRLTGLRRQHRSHRYGAKPSPTRASFRFTIASGRRPGEPY